MFYVSVWVCVFGSLQVCDLVVEFSGRFDWSARATVLGCVVDGDYDLLRGDVYGCYCCEQC